MGSPSGFASALSADFLAAALVFRLVLRRLVVFFSCSSAFASVSFSAFGVSPVTALLHLSARTRLAALLATEPAPPARRLVDVLGARLVDLPPDPATTADPLFNVNTPDDLARAEAILAAARGPR